MYYKVVVDKSKRKIVEVEDTPKNELICESCCCDLPPAASILICGPCLQEWADV